MSNLLFAVVVMLTFVGSVLISKPTSFWGGKALEKEDKKVKKFKDVYENNLKYGMSFSDVYKKLQSLRIFKTPCSVASMANGYSTWRWVSKDNLKFKLIVECSFFDNKFLCKEKKLRLSES